MRRDGGRRGIGIPPEEGAVDGVVLVQRPPRVLLVLDRTVDPYPEKGADHLQLVEEYGVPRAARELVVEGEVGLHERGEVAHRGAHALHVLTEARQLLVGEALGG